MKKKYQLSVIVPVYNSTTTLPILAKIIIDVLDAIKINFQLIFINDGSKDNSWSTLVDLQQSLPQMTIINLKANFGQHNAIMASLNYVDSEYIVTIDDDLQYDPKEISRLYDKISKNPSIDVIFGIPEDKKSPLIKKIGAILGYRIALKKGKSNRKLSISSFRIFRAHIAAKLLQYEYPNLIIGVAIYSITDKIMNLPVKHYPRSNGKSGYNIVKLINHFLNIVTHYAQSRRAKLKTIFLSMLSLILFVFLIGVLMHFEYIMPSMITKLLIIVCAGAISGLLIINLLILIKYIVRLKQQITKEPQYIIQDIIRSDI